MCTATIIRDGLHLCVTMNRDEARSRGPELPPRLYRGMEGEVEWLGPLDQDSRGTWIGVNREGVVALLTNDYSITVSEDESYPSRGEIVPSLLRVGHAGEITAWLNESFDPSYYRPFRLAVMERGMGMEYHWTGQEKLLKKKLSAPRALLASSSWRQGEVVQWRSDYFDQLQPGGEPADQAIRFHAGQPADRAMWGPLIDRPGAATRSIVQVRADYTEAKAELEYWPDPKANSPGQSELHALEFTGLPDEAFPS